MHFVEALLIGCEFNMIFLGQYLVCVGGACIGVWVCARVRVCVRQGMKETS
jgi:hypothetical protein